MLAVVSLWLELQGKGAWRNNGWLSKSIVSARRENQSRPDPLGRLAWSRLAKIPRAASLMLERA